MFVNTAPPTPSPAPAASAASPHLPWLDGLRGIAALWVLLHHAYVLVGGSGMPILSWGKLAVDLFMLLSGFLMAHHYLLRRTSRPWNQASTWKDFWVRRWFRISPLYYLLLAVALVLGSWLGDQRDAIASVWPATATASARYADLSLTNIALHLSYLFGALPTYAFRTALPDWSIGLEMQFYLCFPFLMLALDRFGPIRTGLGLVAVCLLARLLFPDFFGAFQMPSFLPLKLYVFVIGIWMAWAQTQTKRRTYLLAALAVCMLYIADERNPQAVARALMVLALFHMVRPFAGPLLAVRVGLQQRLARLLSGRIARFMGDTSYGLYLLHLLFVIPVAGWLSTLPAFVVLPAGVRLLVCVALAAPPSYAGAWLLFRGVELPGIALGKRWLQARATRLGGTGQQRGVTAPATP